MVSSTIQFLVSLFALFVSRVYKNLNIATDNLPGGQLKKLPNLFSVYFFSLFVSGVYKDLNIETDDLPGDELKKLFALYVSDLNIETGNIPGSELKKLWNVVENGEKADRQNVVQA